MAWIIDISGTKADVIAAVKDLTFQSFLDSAKERRIVNDAEELLAQRNGKVRNPQYTRAGAIAKVFAQLDDWAAAQFERAKTFVLAELEACETSHVGVCARPMPNPLEAPRGGSKHRGTLSISISEYNGE